MRRESFEVVMYDGTKGDEEHSRTRKVFAVFATVHALDVGRWPGASKQTVSQRFG